MILASFDNEAALGRALSEFRAAGLGPLETYTPAPMQGASGASPIPLLVLLAGLAAGAASFLMQAYSSIFAYPFDIGGRPAFAWPSFIPTVFENAVLAAVATGFIAFLVINGLPRMYDAIDEYTLFAEASRDGWMLHLGSDDPATQARARDILREIGPVLVEERKA